MKSPVRFIAAALLGAVAGNAIVGHASAGNAPMLELFTSHGCSSCPPADKFLGQYIEQYPDAVALEFHVDYWDDLVHGRHGAWKDPFSDARYTDRQREYYQLRMDGRAGVYTPQAIIGGAHAELGSAGNRIRKLTTRLSSPLEVSVTEQDGELVAAINGKHAAGATVWLAAFQRASETQIKTGENHGKALRNHHIVRSLMPAGQWRGEPVQIPLRQAVSNEKMGCAVFVQAPDLGPVLGAAYCP